MADNRALDTDTVFFEENETRVSDMMANAIHRLRVITVTCTRLVCAGASVSIGDEALGNATRRRASAVLPSIVRRYKCAVSVSIPTSYDVERRHS